MNVSLNLLDVLIILTVCTKSALKNKIKNVKKHLNSFSYLFCLVPQNINNQKNYLLPKGAAWLRNIKDSIFSCLWFFFNSTRNLFKLIYLRGPKGNKININLTKCIYLFVYLRPNRPTKKSHVTHNYNLIWKEKISKRKGKCGWEKKESIDCFTSANPSKDCYH